MPTSASWRPRAERYDTYVAGVRADFAHVADEDFRAGRAAVLTDLASKPSLFHTPQGRELWESPARANLDRGARAAHARGQRSASWR